MPEQLNETPVKSNFKRKIQQLKSLVKQKDDELSDLKSAITTHFKVTKGKFEEEKKLDHSEKPSVLNNRTSILSKVRIYNLFIYRKLVMRKTILV